MKKITFIAVILIALSAIWGSCKKDENNVTPPPPENEFLSTVKLVVTNAADTTDIHTAKWVQLLAGTTPDTSLATLTLKKNAVYNAKVYFLDETKSPVGDITAEVRDRANYHLICFQVFSTPGAFNGLNLTVHRTDHDTNTPALELGLTNTFTTGEVGSGRLEVSLHHQPNIKTGDCSLGSTDADVFFRVTVQ